MPASPNPPSRTKRRRAPRVDAPRPKPNVPERRGVCCFGTLVETRAAAMTHEENG
jgi:hypothetical protein